jgi:DNA topoisomerase-1
MGNSKKVVIESEVKCPNCGKPMIVRTNRYGSQFLGCSGYPDCKTILSLDKAGNVIKNADEPEKSDEKCEKCGGDLYIKIGPYGRYTECSECKDRKSIVKTTGVVCPKCKKGEIIERKSKRGVIFYSCNKYPECDFALWNEPTGDECPDCGSLLVKRTTKSGDIIECSNRACGYKAEN